MNLAVWSNQSILVWIHFIAALIALGTGIYQLISKKGTYTHKLLGRIWAILMLVIALSSFGIREVMPNSIIFGFSPVHAISVFVIYMIIKGIYTARTGQIKAHKRAMTYTFFGGLIIAGLFTFAPGRLLYLTFFS